MANETISNWVDKAKANTAIPAEDNVKVVRREAAPTKGQIIMDIADKLWPWLLETLKDVRDNTGMLLQPAHIRGIALTMAQDLANRSEKKRPNA